MAHLSFEFAGQDRVLRAKRAELTEFPVSFRAAGACRSLRWPSGRNPASRLQPKQFVKPAAQHAAHFNAAVDA
jgi:hypothetical protein